MQGIGGRLFSPYYRAFLAEALWRLGRRREALAERERAMECARGTDARYWDAELHRLRGEMISQLDDAAQPQAEVCFRTAIEITQKR